MSKFSDDTTCRICFTKQDAVFSLFRKRKGISPCEKLNKIGVKTDVNDVGPTCICCDCLAELDTTINFLDKCQKANQILAEQFSKLCEFTEDDRSDSKLPPHNDGVYFENRVVESVQDQNVDSNSGDVRISEALVWEDARCEECGSRRRCTHWAPPSTHTCPQCKKVFTRKFNFKLHLKRHSLVSEWWCGRCGANAASAALAERHCRPRPRRACPVPGCGKTYTTNTNLNTHLRGHNGERPFECNDCDKKFASKDTLQNHIRIHTGALPYICPICGKRFRTNKVSAHMRRHQGAAGPRQAGARQAGARQAGARQPDARLSGPRMSRAAPHHACALCNARYRHKQSLNKHVRKQHAQKSITTEVATSEIHRETECNL